MKQEIEGLSFADDHYLTLQDDMASVAYWYQLEPHNPFPALPSKEELIIKKENPDLFEGFEFEKH